MIFNQWYVILESGELRKNKPLRVKRLNLYLALWRDENGMVSCIDDRCCHRGVSLSCGKIVNGNLECPFHGFIYNSDGNVEVIPAIGKNRKPPETMKVRAFKTWEKYGLIWLWWGDEYKSTEKPFFFGELESFSYLSFRDSWRVHYSRAIENQLDVVHLPFVHKTTIGRGNKTLVNGPVVVRDNELITFYVKNTVDDGSTEPQRPDEIQDYEKLFHLQFHYPNIWQNFISDKIRAFAAFVPVDDENTIVIIRYYQKMFMIPLVKQLVNLIGVWASIIILRQDKRVVETQLPRKSALKMDERLIMGDKPIIEYRKHREELMEESPKSEVMSHMPEV
jgi:phenylpropionate dioxygenase-like ring-hydroxylating dioxygenase large terminal subunit